MDISHSDIVCKHINSEWKGSEVVSDEWYARPALFVGDIDRSVDFYVTLSIERSMRTDSREP